jgi:hypothetical protein
MCSEATTNSHSVFQKQKYCISILERKADGSQAGVVMQTAMLPTMPTDFAAPAKSTPLHRRPSE